MNKNSEWMIHRFPDINTRNEIMDQYPDFCSDTMEEVNPELVTNLVIHGNTGDSMIGLDIFVNMREFTLRVPSDSCPDEDDCEIKESKRWNLYIPESWTQLESLHISSQYIGDVVLPVRMDALKTLYISTFDASANVILPETAPELVEITIIGGRRERWASLDWPSPDRLFIENYPSLKTLDIIDYDRSMLSLSHLPALERLKYSGDGERYYESQELCLYDVPRIKSIIKHGCLHKIRLPGSEDDPNTNCPITGGQKVPICTEMPEENISLVELDLAGNWLSSLALPKRMQALERLDLSDGCLRSLVLPERMQALEHLNLSDNCLDEIILPEELPAYVCLRKNRIAFFEVSAKQPKLKSLDISDNIISELCLPPQLPALEALDISKNPIRRIPVKSIPNLRELNASYTDIESWIDLPISNPPALEKLSVQISSGEEIDEITAIFTRLRVLAPFITDVASLSFLLGKWRLNEGYPREKSAFVNGVIVRDMKYTATGKYEVFLDNLPGMGSLSSIKYVISCSDGIILDRGKGVLYLDDIDGVKTITIHRTLHSDNVNYHFEAFVSEPNLLRPDNEWEGAVPKAYVYLKDGVLALKLKSMPVSRVRGVLKIENYIFNMRDGQWDVEAEEVSWTLPKGFDYSERKVNVEISGLYGHGWIKAAPYAFELWIWGDEGDSRKNRYPARYFLECFPDANVRAVVAGLFPDTDFSPDSKESIDTSAIKRIDVNAPESLAGLEVFRLLEHYHQKGGLFAKYQDALKDWVSIQTITVEDAVVGHTFFDYRIRATEIRFTKCRLISTSPEYDGGYIRLSRPALQLKKFSVTFTKSNLNSKHKIEFPSATGIREMDLNGGDFSEFSFPSRSLYHTEKLDLRGNNFPRLFELCDRPRLRDLRLSPSEERDSDLEEIYLSALPLVNLSVEDFPKLKALRLPSAEDKTKFAYVVQPKIMYTPLLPGITIADCPELRSLVFPNEERYTGWITACDCGLESVTLPDVLPENVNLRNNRLSVLPCFSKQDRLKELDVSGNLLETLVVDEVPGLQDLNVSANKINALELPAEMPSLEILRIDHNPIGYMPDILAPNLAVLYTANTGIASWKDLRVDHPEKLRVLSARIDSASELDEIERAFPNLLVFHPYIHFTSMDLAGLFGKWNNVDERDIGSIASHKRLWEQKTIYAHDIPFTVRGERGKEFGCIDCRDLPGIMELVYRGYVLRSSKRYSHAKCKVDSKSLMLTVENLNKIKANEAANFEYWAHAQFEIVDKNSGIGILYCFICRSSK